MLIWVVIIIVVAVLDQWSKWQVLAYFTYGGQIEVTGFFDLVLAYNPGAAFSFLADHSGWQKWLFIALAAIVCVWLSALIWQHRSERLVPFSFSLVVGGATGNVIDRFVHGKVVDFLSFHWGEHYWPAFNIADAAICLGVFLMLAAQFKQPGKPA